MINPGERVADLHEAGLATTRSSDQWQRQIAANSGRRSTAAIGHVLSALKSTWP
jgi:hypothetical protein